MRIGLDFDGVISDCCRLKSYGAKKLYGVEIPPKKFKRELIIGEGILTSEQYTNLQKQIYDTREIGLTMLPVNGALKYIPKLQQGGHDLSIITSRPDIEIPREWLHLKKLDLPITSVPRGSTKAEACKGLEVYVDDDLDKLEPLIDVVPNRFLFSWGYNKHIELNPKIATRVKSWPDLYQKIKKI